MRHRCRDGPIVSSMCASLVLSLVWIRETFLYVGLAFHINLLSPPGQGSWLHNTLSLDTQLRKAYSCGQTVNFGQGILDLLWHKFSQLTISMCLRLPCYKSGSEAISLRGVLGIRMMGGVHKRKVVSHCSLTVFSQVVERFHPNPLAIALKTFYPLYKNLTLPSGAG